uniref:Tr-type G domain-containing protein n=1 Tax=Heterosigma akashiwo TaxID=2829 RepID=A0A6V1P3V7_HETAK|mmetsp:Transcript_25278/g.39856  ORF Transcript_25278/g.39856 Transcript_25278/m.39856 type:complete len:688 (+) Transcript_25278:192-2255(+)
MSDEKKSTGALNPNASSFSFNPNASGFKPSFAPPPPNMPPPPRATFAPQPVSIGATPPPPAQSAPQPVSIGATPPPPAKSAPQPVSIGAAPPAPAPSAPKPVDLSQPMAAVNISDNANEPEEEIDENDPLWKVTLQLAGGDRAAALKLLEDPDALMSRPEVVAVLGSGDLEVTEGGDSWEEAAAPAAAATPEAAAEEAKSPPPAPAGDGDEEKLDPAEEARLAAEEAAAEMANAIEADPRQHLNIVFIGHVDAGKSTLSGQILYCTDFVDRRTIEKYEREAKERNRESWFLAFIMDTNEEERQKGKTVEVGRAHFESENKRYTILDAPGHKSYVPNMISGAAQADVGILVISARKGEFETGFEKGGQTREHALLAKTLGVIKLIVVINKMDDPTVEWDQGRFEECVTKLRPFLRTCGYAVKRDVLFIPISGLTGANIKDEVGADVCPWWRPMVEAGDALTSQATLLGALDSLDVDSHRDPAAPFVMSVLDRYHERGTIVLGKVDQGTVSAGQRVLVMPTRQRAEVQGVWINDDPVMGAKPGENVKLKMNVGMDEVHKGFVLTDAQRPVVHAVTSFVVQLALVETLPERPLWTAGYPCMLHSHTVEVECVCTELICVVDKKTGKKRRLPHATKGSMLECRLEVEQSICVETFKRLPSLGRFTLRDSGKEQGITIGIGKILKIDLPKKK